MNITPLPDDQRSDEAIMSAALAISCEEGGEEYWAHVRILQHRIDAHLLIKLGTLLPQSEAKQRVLIADVLAQSRVEKKQMVDECVALLIRNLKSELSPRVLESLCHALGHLKSPVALDSLLNLQNHSDAGVRLAVVHGISCQDDPLAIAALITLSADLDRDSATDLINHEQAALDKLAVNLPLALTNAAWNPQLALTKIQTAFTKMEQDRQLITGDLQSLATSISNAPAKSSFFNFKLKVN